MHARLTARPLWPAFKPTSLLPEIWRTNTGEGTGAAEKRQYISMTSQRDPFVGFYLPPSSFFFSFVGNKTCTKLDLTKSDVWTTMAEGSIVNMTYVFYTRFWYEDYWCRYWHIACRSMGTFSALFFFFIIYLGISGGFSFFGISLFFLWSMLLTAID